MSDILVGVVILIVIGALFWLIFPIFLNRYRRDDRNRDQDDSENKNQS